MTLLNLSNVGVSFGAEDVLEEITCAVNAGDRIGIVGRNGAGKTSLLRVLAGTLGLTSGARHVARGTRVALVEQVTMADDGRADATVREEALAQMSGVLRLEMELHEAAQALSAGRPGAAEHYGALHQRFEVEGGFTYENQLRQVLTGLGFGEEDFDRPVSTLSGGQRSRLELAKALMAAPDVLLMDEPTNHLDFAGLSWLEDFLRRRQGTLVVVSHDRYFLDKVATRIWLVAGGGLRAYRGNYSKFQEQRAAEIERQRIEHERQKVYIAKEESFIRRYRAGQRAGEARGRAKKLARLERIEAPKTERRAVIRLEASRTGEVVLRAGGLAIGHAGQALLLLGDLEVERGARIALLGPNGTGKTTLLRTLAGDLPPVDGSVHCGSNVRIGRYWQEAEHLDPDATVLDEMLGEADSGIQGARDLLGLMLFSGEDVKRRVGTLSGGERGRLALARLMISKANLLLLDEPTNHLDIPGREALEASLSRYTGTMIFASHDRRLIEKLATRLWVMEGGRFLEFDGRPAEYLTPDRRASTAAAPAKRGAGRATSGTAGQRRQAVADLEAEIERGEKEMSELEAAIQAASASEDVRVLAEMGRRYEELRVKIQAMVHRWAEEASVLTSRER